MKNSMPTAERITELLEMVMNDFVSDEEVVQYIDEIVLLSGGELSSTGADLCVLCGSMPMTTDCNNARCEDI